MNTSQKIAFNLAKILKWIEFPLFFVSIVWFVYMAIILDQSCINTICRSNQLIDGNLYNTTIKYVLPVLAILGIFRLGLNFFANHIESDMQDRKHWSFYLGLIGLVASYCVLGNFSKDFLYFNNKAEVQVDSLYVVYELILFGVSSFLLLKNKIVWDKMTFFGKIRLFYYLFEMVLLLINLNLGVLTFMLFAPFLIVADWFYRIHINWSET